MRDRKSRNAEQLALDVLRDRYSYLFFELKQKAERETLITQLRGKRLMLKSAVAIKLVVPERSALGKEIVAMRKRKEREAVKKKHKTDVRSRRFSRARND